MPTTLRVVRQSGMRYWLRIYWGKLNADQHNGWSYHNATRLLGDGPLMLTPEGYHGHSGSESNYPNPADWPKACDYCGAPAPMETFPKGSRGSQDDGVQFQLFTKTLYKPDGEEGTGRLPQPGDIVDAFWMSREEPFTGTRLIVYTPDGWAWNNGVASNCPHGFSGENRKNAPHLHCCWTVTGTLPKITVRMSIVSPAWHGFITEGVAEP